MATIEYEINPSNSTISKTFYANITNNDYVYIHNGGNQLDDNYPVITGIDPVCTGIDSIYKDFVLYYYSPGRSEDTFKIYNYELKGYPKKPGKYRINTRNFYTYDPGGSGIHYIYPRYACNEGEFWLYVYGKFYARLEYNANGGTGQPATVSFTSPDTQENSYSWSVNISNTEPTWTNHVFLGWSLYSDVSSPMYKPGDLIIIEGNAPSANVITLYAVWNQNWYSVLKFDANGGTGAPYSNYRYSNQRVIPADRTVRIDSTTPTNSNKIFLGWNTDSTATTATYHPGDNINVPYLPTDIGLTLYAIWTANWKYQLKFNYNTGTDGPSDIINTISQYNKPDDAVIPIPTKTPLKSKYRFAGWSTTQYEPGTGTAEYVVGDNITIPYSDTTDGTIVTLYAVWSLNFNTIYSQHDGTWKKTTDIYAKLNDSWRRVDKVYIKKNDVWVEQQ